MVFKLRGKKRGSLVQLKLQDRNLKSGQILVVQMSEKTASGSRGGKHECHMLDAIHQRWQPSVAKYTYRAKM